MSIQITTEQDNLWNRVNVEGEKLIEAMSGEIQNGALRESPMPTPGRTLDSEELPALSLEPRQAMSEQLTTASRKFRFLPGPSRPAGVELSDSEELIDLYLFSHEEVISIIWVIIFPLSHHWRVHFLMRLYEGTMRRKTKRRNISSRHGPYAIPLL